MSLRNGGTWSWSGGDKGLHTGCTSKVEPTINYITVQHLWALGKKFKNYPYVLGFCTGNSSDGKAEGFEVGIQGSSLHVWASSDS